jgi:hypothetical protein
MKGGGAISYPAKSGAYSQDFNALADGTILRTLTGWGAYNSGGSTASDAYTVSGGALTSNGDFGTQPVGSYVHGYDTASADHVFRVTMTEIPTGNLRLVVAGTHELNAIVFWSFQRDSTHLSTCFIEKRDATGTVTLWVGGGINSPLGRDLMGGDTIELRVLGRRIHYYANGIQMTPAGGADIDNTRAFTKGTKVGFGTYNAFGGKFDNVYAAPLTAWIEHDAISMAWANMANDGTSNVAGSFPIFWPCKLGTGSRKVPLTFTYTGTVSDIDHRVVHYSTGAVAQDWQRVPTADRTLSAGVGTASVSLPMANTATFPAYRVEIRASNDIDTGVRTPVTTVGLLVGNDGQSNSAARDSGTGVSPTTPYTWANAYFWSSRQGKTWHGGVAGTGEVSPGFEYAHELAAITGIPCGVFIGGVGAQAIDTLIASDTTYQNGGGTSGGSYWDDYVTELQSKQCNADGYLEHVEWTQGEAESEGASLMTNADATAYRGKFDTFLSLIRAHMASPTSPVSVCIIGQNATDKGAASATANANWTLMRQTLFGLTDKTNVRVSASLMDLKHADADPLHYHGDSYKEANRRGARTAAKALGYTTYDGRGPFITGATRSGATITLAVNLNGASSISGTGLTNYEVSTDDFATTKAISSVAVSGSTIVITLSANPGAVVKVRSFAGYWPERGQGNGERR